MLRNITDRKQVEKALQKAHDELEKRVEQRTKELQAANMQLQQEITERKRVEEVLLKSEQKFREMAELLPETIYECDLEGTLTFVNKTAFIKFGYTSKDVEKGLNAFQMVAIEDRERAVDSFKRVIKGEKTEPDKFTCLCKDGTIFPAIIYSAPIIHNNHSIGLRGIIVDISHWVGVEKQLAETNQELIQQQNIFISGPAVIFKWAESGAKPVEYVSENVLKVLGYLVEEFISGDIIYKDIVHIDDWKTLAQEVNDNTKQRRDSFEQTPYRLKRKDGRYIWVADYTTVIRDEKGKVINYLGYILDITKQKQAVAAIRESEIKYRSIVDNSLEGIYITQKHIIQFCNQKFAEMFGFNNYRQAIGWHIKELVSQQDWEKVDRAVKRRESGQEMVAHYTFTARRIDGSEFEVETMGSRIMYQDAPGIQGVMRDVSEKLNLEAQLQQAQKMEAIGQLAGGVAHDFNNMLGGIIGYTELALSRVEEDNTVNRYLRYIIDKCDNAAVLVRQLLAFSRRQVLNLRHLNFNLNIEDSLRFLERVIGENINVTVDLAKDLHPINADPTVIDQILTNLCINCRDAMPDGGILSISTINTYLDETFCQLKPGLIPGDYIHLTVTDNGMGMDPQTLARIFEPFFTTKEIGQGTGLGLAMVYGQVNQHNGYIECTSELKQGSSFNLYFPAITDGSVQEEIWEDGEAPGGNETLLLVEDDLDLLKITKSVLEKFGYTVITAGHGKEALPKFKDAKADISLVICDVVMPEMGGIELFDIIHLKSPGVKFLFISGYAPDKSFQQYADLPQVELLQKPFRKTTIAHKIRKLLDQK